MKFIFTLIILFFSYTTLQAQNLTGIWRGSFEQSNLDINTSKFVSETYKYEVQINDLQTSAIEGVTYSYLTTVFYGKAALRGIFNKKGKTVTLKETILVEVKSAGRSEACLMTCYLDYSKVGKLETLTGTYSSIKEKYKGDCGSGTVYLEKVTESDFEKEPFLLKKKASILPKESIAKKSNTTNNATAKNNSLANKKTNTNIAKNTLATKINNHIVTKKENTAKPNTATVLKFKTTKPGADKYVIKKENHKKTDSTIVAQKDTLQQEPTPQKLAIKTVEEPKDAVLKERQNKLMNTVYVDAKEVTLEFYDNGEIDNDTISVYQDNKLLLNQKRLSTNPIVLNLKFDDFNTFYELILVAENLGDIPPNTALMVINYGRKRREIFLTSDEKNNAKLIIEYKK